MCSESFPKDFEKTTEVLPLDKYGLSSLEEFQKAEDDIQHLEWLKKAGLNSSEIKLYQDNESGKLELNKNLEACVLKEKLKEIYKKIHKLKNDDESEDEEEPQISRSENSTMSQNSQTKYPEGHPMNNIKDLEDNLFGHLQHEMLPITKRRKILRHLERRKERILSQDKQLTSKTVITGEVKPGSLWDVKELPHKSNITHTEQCTNQDAAQSPSTSSQSEKIIGPKMPTMYTIKDSKIVRLEPVNVDDEYRAVDIVMPVNAAEEQLLEGTKMTIDDIKKIERFKDYEPGVPSKVLYLKNIAPSVTQEQLSLLFNQFILENGGPIDIRLMTGRMRGQAFVAFTNEDIAIQALEETNGTILSGRPVIVQFGRNTNRIQEDDVG